MNFVKASGHAIMSFRRFFIKKKLYKLCFMFSGLVIISATILFKVCIFTVNNI
jgi:hypothetical protein